MDVRRKWARVLREESKAEDEAQKSYPVKLLRAESREAVWKMCLDLDYDFNGVAGLSCQQLEKYLSKMYHLKDESRLSAQEDSRFNKLTKEQFPLLIAVSILLVAKATQNRENKSNQQIQEYLKSHGIEVSYKEIMKLEFEVFSKLDFHIPLWTNVDAAFYLALESGLLKENLDCVGNVVVFSGYKRDVIEEKIIAKFEDFNIEGGVTYVLTLHLIAGAIAGAINLLTIRNADIVPKLSRLVKCSVRNINCISSVIELVMHETPFNF